MSLYNEIYVILSWKYDALKIRVLFLQERPATYLYYSKWYKTRIWAVGRGNRDYDQRFDHKIACPTSCDFVVPQDTAKEHYTYALFHHAVQLEDVTHLSLLKSSTSYFFFMCHFPGWMMITCKYNVLTWTWKHKNWH